MPTRKKVELVDRSLVLGAILFRSLFEGAALIPGALPDASNAEQMAAGVTNWLREAGLMRAVTDPERMMLVQPPLTWERKVVVSIQSAFLEESLCALLMCVGVVTKMCPYDREMDTDALLHLLPFLSDSPFVVSPDMKPADEYASMVGSVKSPDQSVLAPEIRRTELFWWRAVSHSAVNAGRLPAAQVQKVLTEIAPETKALGIPTAENGELLVGSTPYSDLTIKQHARICARTEARIRAFRWQKSNVAWTHVDMSS